MQTIPFTGDHRQTIALVVIAVLVLGAAALGYLIFCRRQEEKDAAQRAAEDAAEAAQAPYTAEKDDAQAKSEPPTQEEDGE
jgi:Tfp pilus assembly protein PilV